ncbi:Grainyhead-like protein 2 [Tolypocladium ophioglossoides CBS 100239]|uniref:Grainyhead-like protein 2 n=1 Tax=Tolypocladium ophioglossoides (strain CBS 100239) TaxID=1163406 RepID=A0A0L0NH70_TOLOC|nr:Grainyhead-like protein 2 [Tolypocladium ophioglossoides CBS 100239]
MFRQRTSTQKPADDLLANFRQQFPEVSAVTTDASPPAMSLTTVANHPTINAPTQEDSQHADNESFRDQDPTPRASHEPWRFTPSLLDPNSYAFNSFANAPPGYYTPTPGGIGTLLHPQAGDLHTPNMAMGHGLGTSLSMPNSGNAIHPGATTMDLAGFQTLQPHQFHHFNPFIQAPPPQAGFAPSTFVHQDTGYETMEPDSSPMDSDPSDERMPTIATTLHSQKMSGVPMGLPLPASAEKFRYHSTLNAPTAMVKHADEIPVTYLNKGQAYSLSIADTSGMIPVQPGTKYRTFVRISFEDDEQRQKPGVCWSLWKEGRGTSEAHQRGGKLQAVEFVESGQPAEGDDKTTRVELETSSFDGFSVIWTPGINGAPEVSIAVRFNFLSTDFSHSKGVKGIPVRLCAKTSPFSPDGSQPVADTAREICFCKVKLFRDHGAERKLSNDVAHVKNSIDKLKQQLAQIESGMKDFGKRKRHSVASQGADPQRHGKVPKHKRTWSMSSASSAGGGGARMTMEEDLHFKLQTLQDMFTSTRPVSVLYLRGEDLDDPDLHPISLPGEMSPPGRTDSVRDGPNWQTRSAQSSAAGSLASPSPSSTSLASQASAMGSANMWQNVDSTAPCDAGLKGPEPLSRVAKTGDDGTLSGWIEALGVDPSYRPPPERTEKPVACFYVLHQTKARSDKHVYHRAIYLMKRTLEEFNGRIASKWGLGTLRILRTIHVIRGGLEVEMDDDVVRELKEGQDMRLEIEEIATQWPPAKREWEMSIDEIGDEATARPDMTKGLVLRLLF